MKKEISIAIETSCRLGGVALGRGDEIIKVVACDAATRHATQLVSRLKELLASHGLSPGKLDHVYVSAGPGSFTGLRIGITVARTLAQAVQHLRCVAVPTALAVAENVRHLRWEYLAVITDARQGCVYASLLARDGERIVPAGKGVVATPDEFLAQAPRPLLLAGEGLAYHDLTARGDAVADEAGNLPTAEGVWRVGRRMAAEGTFTDYRRLLPTYTRRVVASQGARGPRPRGGAGS